MFSLKEFVKKGLLSAVGRLEDYQVILNAAGWHEKGVLTEEELAEIDAAIEAFHSEAPEEEEPEDGNPEEDGEEMLA